MSRVAQAILVGGCGVLLWWSLRGADFAQRRGEASHPHVVAPASSSPVRTLTPAQVAASRAPYRISPFGPPPSTLPSAADTMAAAREYGDERAPPVDPETDTGSPPTPWELRDPARYLEYEGGQGQAVKAQVLLAIESQLPRWREALEVARSRGAAAEDLAAAEEKLRRLEATEAALKKESRPLRR